MYSNLACVFGFISLPAFKRDAGRHCALLAEMSVKRQRNIDLYYAQVDPVRIANIINVHKATVYRIIDRYKTTNSVAHKSPGHPANKSRTKEFREELEVNINYNPTKSMRQLTKDNSIVRENPQKAIKDGHGMKSKAQPPKQLLTTSNKENRLSLCKKIHSCLKRHPWRSFQTRNSSRQDSCGGPPCQQDEASSLCDGLWDCGLCSQEAPSLRPQWPQDWPARLPGREEGGKALVGWQLPWHTIAGNRTLPQVTRPRSCTSGALPSCRTFGHQCGGHLKVCLPIACLLDYSVWSVVEKDACRTSHCNTKELKSSITAAWESMTPEYIKATCMQFRQRLEKMVVANGGHFE